MDSGVALVTVSSDELATAAEMKHELKLQFPLLSDPQRQVIRNYGVFHEDEPKGRAIARPTTVLIDRDGLIRYRYVGQAPTDRPTPDDMLAEIRQMKSEK